ncbi:ABC transporter substrate-binding protein [Acrocarpospora sp. B8E8]|uniref:ABC transporter substrate-binding protein n=1 Tax=Acrocarpospora sp. B8E8 TaxID=3153572 RepID=UPI00325C8F4C
MQKPTGYLAAGLTISAVLTACGTTNEGAVSDSGPIRIAFMDILSGPQAVTGGDNSLKLAIEEINAAGGVKGRKLEYKKFDTDITPEAAARATNLALDYKPSVIIGYGVSSGLRASVAAVNKAGVPVIHGTLAKLTSPDSLKTKLTFRIGPTTTQYALAANSYLFNDLGVKKLTIVHTQDAAPTEGAAAIIADAKRVGVATVERAVPPTTTDLTEPVLAAKGSDAIWEWGYATTDALMVKQAAQNNVGVPIMTFSVGTAALRGLIPKDLLTDKITSVSSCAPYALDGERPKQYMAAYQKAFGESPTDANSPRYYDAVYLLKAAIEKAGSADPQKVAGAIEQTTLQGACGEIKADEHHNLIHDIPIIKWTGGSPQLVKLVEDIKSDF